ncbi:MAG: nuclear transport factor 2 family protein [Rhodospirillaceae bacterium]|nr:nuclear transport factor 2 family protein [Rhodospirillaceae bacterium]
MSDLLRKLCFGVACVLVAANVSAAADTPDAKTKAQGEIWAKEQKIYADRANGGLAYYIVNTSPNYIGWPPNSAKPLAQTGLKNDSKAMAGKTQEKLTMELMDFTLSGDTAIIYYLNHRTARPDGTAVDEKFENIHVWTRENGDWKLMGGMARLQPAR